MLVQKLFKTFCWWLCAIQRHNDCQTLQDDLSTMAELVIIMWKLNFNISKCKVMCITNKKLTPTFINNRTLEWVTVFKYLGLLIDYKLKWNDQTNHAVAKATKILNLLRRNLHHSSKTAKSRAFSALVRPHLEYSAPVWSPHTKINTTKLENFQKRAARWIEAKWNRANYCWIKSYDNCRKSLSLLSLEDRRRLYWQCCQTYKIINYLYKLDKSYWLIDWLIDWLMCV